MIFLTVWSVFLFKLETLDPWLEFIHWGSKLWLITCVFPFIFRFETAFFIIVYFFFLFFYYFASSCFHLHLIFWSFCFWSSCFESSSSLIILFSFYHLAFFSFRDFLIMLRFFALFFDHLVFSLYFCFRIFFCFHFFASAIFWSSYVSFLQQLCDNLAFFSSAMWSPFFEKKESFMWTF